MQFVFRLCRDLGIDDPIAWMDCVPANVVDRWIAFYILEAEEGKKRMTPDETRQKLEVL